MENIKIEKLNIKTMQDFEKICDSWKKLEQGKDMTIFQSYNWNKLLIEEEKKRVFSDFYTDIDILIIKLKDNIVGILPLIIQKHSNKTKWFGRKKGIYILGHNSWSDYLNIVYGGGYQILA